MIHPSDDALRDKAWAADWFARNLPDVPRETWGQLETYVALLLEAAKAQNLIAASTLDIVWSRHIIDSLQLLRHVPTGKSDDIWLDLGSGAGLPGIPIATCFPGHVHLVESRALRCAFLQLVVKQLGLSDRVTIHEMPLARCALGPVSVISARAFAPLPKLLAAAERFSNGKTHWVLPKGQNAAKEVEILPPVWQKMFHVKPSMTDADAAILYAQGMFTSPKAVRPGKKRKKI
jgi:16S rRNA (guanine527-N7)-methyltransferase